MPYRGPRVRTEAFDLGGILREGLIGYDVSRQRKQERQRVKRQEGREDREENRYLRELRAADLAQPGARDLSEYLGDPQSAQLTQETLSQVGRADQANVPLAFERPAPTQVTLPGGDTRTFQERAPHLTASGIVMDPQAARSEQTLGTILDEQLKKSFEKPPETAADREARIEGDARARAAGTAAGTPEKPERRPTIPHGTAQDVMNGMYGQWDQKSGGYFWPSWMSPSIQQEILRRIMAGEPLPPRPEQMLGNVIGNVFGGFLGGAGEGSEERSAPQGTPLPVAKPIFARPPAAAESPDLFTRVRGAQPPRLDVTRPLPADTATVPAETPSASEIPAPSPPDAGTDLTLAQKQDMAAKEWEELIDAGTDPDEATRILREKYGLTGGQ